MKTTEIIKNNPIRAPFPSLILGLDISTACIGISIIYDDGKNEPVIEFISHVLPKIDKEKTGIEALILRKEIFENDFLTKIEEITGNLDCPLKTITECVIESPMTYATGSSNAATVAMLLQFNGILSDSVYRVLGIIPYYISSYDARMASFPELLTIRKFNKRGEIYPVKHIDKAIKDNNLVLFGSYPFDCEKKSIMMNAVSDKYPKIPWIYNKKGQLKKENYDSCDALVCAIAYSNLKRHGEIDARIIQSTKTECLNGETKFAYTVQLWDKTYIHELVVPAPVSDDAEKED